MKNYWNKTLIFFFSLMVVSCNIKQELTVNDFSTISIEEVITKVNSTNPLYKWLNIRGKLKVNTQDGGGSLGFNLKIAEDSLIWISITAPIIGEVNRLMITRDTVYSINRTNSSWFTKNISFFKDEYNINLSLSLIESIITRSIAIPKNNYLSSQDLNSITFDSQNDSSIYVVNLNNYSIELFARKISENEELTVKYIDSQLIDNFLYPKKLNVSAGSENLSFELTLNKIKVLDTDKAPFKIPKNYNETK